MKEYLKTFKELIFEKKTRDILVIFLFIFLTEYIVRLVTDIGTSWALLRMVISSAILSVLFGLFFSIFNKIISKILEILILFVLSVFIFAEVGLYNYIGFYMGLGNAGQGTKTTEYLADFFKSVKPTYYLIFIPFILFLVYILFIDKRLKKYEKIKKSKRVGIKKFIPTLTSLLVIMCFSYLYYCTLVLDFMQNDLQSIKNTELFKYPENSNLSVSQFGVLVYSITDINCNIFNLSDTEETIKYVNNNKDKVVTDYTRKIDDSTWKTLIENTTDSTMNNLNNYFMSRDITNKNDHTGIFKDKNLIVILMESVDDIAINKDYFPTLYKIYNEGISFKNNYSPRNNCSTGNNEMTVMTSLFSINNTCTANTYKNNKYREAIFNVFNNLGYKTTSYHSYTDKYYNRHTIHPNMGSSKFYGVTDLGMSYDEKYEEWPSDVDFFTSALPHFINEEKFMAFFSTVSTHQTYNVPSTLGDMYTNLFDNYDYSLTTKRYLSKMTVLDKALEYMLNELKKNGKLENTVITLFADHYPYGLTTNQINSVLDYDVTVRQEVDRTPMVIYNSERKPESVEKYTSLVDLLPTLLNMFDANYDPRYYLGNDIFSDNDGRAIFTDGSWQDDIGFYRAATGKFIETNSIGKTYTNEEIVSINDDINLKHKMSALAIKNNYFNYLYNGLDKYKEDLTEETNDLNNTLKNE